MGQFSIGQSVRRREDPRLLMGRGRYYDDLKLADQLHAAILRSPHAHADIKSIDTRAALQMPGVHAVLTGKDYEADGLGTHAVDGALQAARRQPDVSAARGRRSRSAGCCMSAIRWRSWSPTRWSWPATPPSASRSTTRRGPPWCRREDAFEPGAPQLYDDCPNNEAYFYQAGDKASDRRRLRQRRARGRAAARHQPRHRQHARAARRHRRIRRRHRPLHPALRLPAAVAVPQRHRPDHAEDSGEPSCG